MAYLSTLRGRKPRQVNSDARDPCIKLCVLVLVDAFNKRGLFMCAFLLHEVLHYRSMD